MTDSSKTATTLPADKMQQMIAVLWRNNEASFQARLRTIRECYQLLSTDRHDDQSRVAAGDAAHKFAGVLGTLGLQRGTELAREAELMLIRSGPIDNVGVDRLGYLIAELEAAIAARSAELKQD